MRLVRRNLEKIKILFVSALLVLSQMAMPLLAVQPVRATDDPIPVAKVDICHATASHSNPYISNSPNTSGDVHGHDDHHTPDPDVIWYDGIQTKWDDIIPPFYYQDNKDDPVLYYEGKNWTDEGQAIWENACSIPGNGKIEVVKNLSPINDPGLFDLYIGRFNVQDVGHRGTTGQQEVTAGDVVVLEKAGASTDLKDYTTNIECRDDDGNVVASGNRTGATSRQMTVAVGEGEEILCIFTNTRIPPISPATITVTKYIDVDGDEKADRTATEGEWEFKLNNGPAVATDSNGQVVFTPLRSGEYLVTEVPQDGYEFVAARGTNCVAGNGATMTASVEAAEVPVDAECTFLNSEIQYGSITIEKVADPETEQEFSFRITDGDRKTDFTLVDDGSSTKNKKEFNKLEEGVYTIREKATDGWDLKNIRCVGSHDGGYKVSVEKRGVRIQLEGNESVKCYFINDRQPVTFVASKIVCTVESDLPNWGNSGPNITDQTAIDWVEKHESCELAEGWDFQWSFNGVGNPGDNTGEAGAGWNTFGPTDANGQTAVNVDDMGDFTRLWFREVFQDGYIPFTGVGGSDVSAEFYCHTDVLNYDNWDWIDNAEYGQDYYCVAWNVALGNIIVGKYEDEDLDGARDKDESGIEDWSFNLYDSNDDQVGSTHQTGPNGYTTFKDLVAGDYTICEVMPQNWISSDLEHSNAYVGHDNQVCKDVTLEGSKNLQAKFGNYELGKVLVNKYEDLNLDGKRNGEEPGLQGWSFNIYDAKGDQIGATKVTGPNGWVTFKELVPGDYSICEVLQNDWYSSDLLFNGAYDGLFENEICLDVTVGSGETVNNFRFGNYQNGSLIVHKYHDLNQNGNWDKDDEPALEGWDFGLSCYASFDKQAAILVSLCDEYGPETTNSDGEATFDDVKPGDYLLWEDVQDGWLAGEVDCSVDTERLANGIYAPYGSHHVEVAPGTEVDCEVGNYQDAELLIDKTNDQIGNVLSTGDTVVYTINVTNPDTSGIVYDAVVSDLLPPEGFDYVSGSWKAVSSVRGDITGTMAEPDYNNATNVPAEWYLGDLVVGETVKLTYSVTIGAGVPNGAYDNVAFVAGCAWMHIDYDGEYDYFDEEESPAYEPCSKQEEVEQPAIYTLSRIDFDGPSGGNVLAVVYGNGADDPFVESGVQIANTETPEQGYVLGLSTTGTPAILSVVLGAVVALAGVTLTRRKKLNWSKFFQGIGRSSAMLILGLLVGGFMMMGTVLAASQLTVSQLETPTTLSSLSLAYQVVTTNPSNTFVVTMNVDGPGTNDYNVSQNITGSQSGTFQLNMPVDGSYQVTVKTDSGETALNVQTVTRDTATPPPVVYNGVVREGNTYTLSFEPSPSADKVLIYASTESEFTANTSTLVGEVGPDETTFVYTAPDDTQRFFALHTVDAAGNYSPLVGDTAVVVTAEPSTGDSTSNGSVTDESAQSTTDLEGATDENADEDSDSNSGFWIVAIAVLVAVGAGVYLLNRPKSTEE